MTFAFIFSQDCEQYGIYVVSLSWVFVMLNLGTKCKRFIGNSALFDLYASFNTIFLAVRPKTGSFCIGNSQIEINKVNLCKKWAYNNLTWRPCQLCAFVSLFFEPSIVFLLKNEKSVKVGVKNKRLKAGWDNRYLLKVLSAGFAAG